MLLWDDTEITHISKGKGKLNIIIKNHTIAHVTILFFFKIQYLFVNFIFEDYMFLPFTRERNNCRWSVKTRKKNGEGKFGYRETVEMNKMLISAHETSRFFRCYDNDTASLTQFFHAHIKDWQTKIYKIGKPAACSFMKTHLKRLKGFSRICFFKKQSIKIIRLRKEIEWSLFH